MEMNDAADSARRAVAQRQMDAVYCLLGTPLPRDVRLALRLFEEQLASQVGVTGGKEAA